MFVDDIHVTQYDEDDLLAVWSFTIDHQTFFNVTLREDDNNLRAWKATIADDRFRPIRWLLDESATRPRLDENDDLVEQHVAAFVREQIAAHQQLGDSAPR